MQNKDVKDRLLAEIEHVRELEERLSDPAVVSDQSLFKQLSREHSRLTPRVKEIETYLSQLNQLDELEVMVGDSSTDKELYDMAKEELTQIRTNLEENWNRIQELLLPPDPNEGKGLIMEIRAGTGGEEAALFVNDLYRMYIQFAENIGLNVELISTMETGIGGYKEVIFAVSGERAYELLHQEGGAHRVQRIPVTESGGRIHTSAVTVAVMPEAEEEEININESDIRVDVYRASGAGGQHVNKTESAVRITHIPTGLVVSCQDERSQIKNRSKAMKVLRARLAEKQESESHAVHAAQKKEQVGSGDRSERIRTYNFPQGRITDHRIGFTAYNLPSFMQGDMDELLYALVKAEKEEKLKNISAGKSTSG